MKRTAFMAAAALACFAFAAPAQAGSLTIRIVDSSGKPVSDAVVTLRPNGAAAPAMTVGSNYRVEQKDIEFHPFVSVIPVGATVAFPNLDPVRHHVYSFSPAKRFELRLFARNEQRSVKFDKPGVVAIGCNIHDSMSAFIYVSDTIWVARSGANGAVTFRDTPGGAFSLTVWHPYLRAPGNLQSQQMTAAAQDRSQLVPVRLRPQPMHNMSGY